MEISCNIIQDLLPSYVDEICSEDSKKLIELHKKDCAGCRECLARMQAETGSEVPEALDEASFDHMKKVRQHYRSVTRRSSLLLLSALLVLLCLVIIRNYVRKESEFDLLGLGLVLMAAAYLTAGEERNMTRAKKKGMLAAAALGGYAVLCMVVSLVVFYYGRVSNDISMMFGTLPFGMSMYAFVSFLRLQFMLVLIAETVLLIIFLVSGARNNEDNTMNAIFCITGGMLALFYLMMQTTLLSVYYHPAGAAIYVSGYTVGILEDGVIAALCYWLLDGRKRKKAREDGETPEGGVKKAKMGKARDDSEESRNEKKNGR